MVACATPRTSCSGRSRGWLLPAVGLEACSYALTGWLLRMLRGDNAIGLVTTTRVALVMWGLGSLLPASPAEGIAMSVSELRRRGVARQHALTMLLVAGWFQFWALVFTAAAAAALVDAVGHPDPDDATRLVVIAAVLAVVAITVVSLTRRPITARLIADAIWWFPHHRRRHRDECAPPGVNEHPRVVSLLGRPARQLGIATAATGWWITDAGCLWIALHATHATSASA